MTSPCICSPSIAAGFRRRLRAWSTGLFLLASGAVVAQQPTEEFDVLHVNEDYRQPVEILDASTRTPDAHYTLFGRTGIFALDLDPVPGGMERLTLDLRALSRLESVSLTTADGDFVELHALRVPARPGVSVTPEGDGYRVVFSGPGLALLAAGGRLQVVDAWR